MESIELQATKKRKSRERKSEREYVCCRQRVNLSVGDEERYSRLVLFSLSVLLLFVQQLAVQVALRLPPPSFSPGPPFLVRDSEAAGLSSAAEYIILI